MLASILELIRAGGILDFIRDLFVGFFSSGWYIAFAILTTLVVLFARPSGAKGADSQDPQSLESPDEDK